MKIIPFILILALCFFKSEGVFSQLVNIESSRLQTDSVRLAGHADISFNYQKTNDITLNVFKTSLITQVKSKNLKQILLVLGNYNLASSNNSTINNSGFGHIRYNYKINKLVRWEVYSQLQFNELLSLRYRFLAGTGARLKLNQGETVSTYLGISTFYEHEQIQDVQETINRDFRMSNYFVLSIKFPKKRGEFTSTTYYQPMLRQFSDYRLTNQSHIQFNITKHLSFNTSLNYFFDFNPPAGVKQSTFELHNGLRWTF